MDGLNYFLLIGALLMFGGIVLGASSMRLGIPFLLVFLVIGMLAGEDGPGGIQFNNYYLGFLVGNLALAVILLDGGLRTKISTFRVALKPSLTLASVGVLLTALCVGAFAALVLDLDWRLALLLGTIIGSTDAAAVFSLLRSSGTRLNDRVASTLEIESGINDPMAIFLTIALIDMLTKGHNVTFLDLALQLLQQFSVGAILGIGFGFLLSETFKRIQVSEGLHALLLCSGGVLAFSLTNIAGGSGFLAVYLVGLVVGNYKNRMTESVFRAMDGMAWLGQSGMFLLLGLLVTPRDILPVALPALSIALFLMIVARPVAVWLSILPFRYQAREVGFIAWVGLRGAVPIVMAVFPLLAGVEHAKLIFNVAFMVVLLSLILQGTSIAFLAKRLGLSVPGKAEPLVQVSLKGGAEPLQLTLVQFQVPKNASVVGANPNYLELPTGCKFVSIMRSHQLLAPAEVNEMQEGDIAGLIVPAISVERLSEIFHAEDKPIKSAQGFYGDFILGGNAILRDVAELYGKLDSDSALQDCSMDEAIRKKLRRPAVQGDTAQLCGLDFTVREIDKGQIAKVGVRLPR